MFPVYGGKCVLRKAVQNRVEKSVKPSGDDDEVEMEVPKWARQQSKYLLARWDKCISMKDMLRNICLFPS
jgi:hypothetical protein